MEIPLKDGTARVDKADDDLVRGFRWQSMRTRTNGVYAYTTIAGRRVYMHHLILNHAPKGRGGGDIDHKNGDGLDNRRANLRRATRRQNNGNQRIRSGGTSALKGVSWSSQHGVWQAHIGVDNTTVFLGLYEREEDAARAYDIAAAESFGEFSLVNFPDRLGESAPLRYSAKSKPRAITVPSKAVTTSNYKQGATNPNAKLSEVDVRLIIASLLAVPRRSQASIAREFGVSQSQVGNIFHRRSWAHLWPEGE